MRTTVGAGIRVVTRASSPDGKRVGAPPRRALLSRPDLLAAPFTHNEQNLGEQSDLASVCGFVADS